MNKIIYGLCIAFFTAVLVVGGDYAYAQAIYPNSGGGGVSQATGNTLWCQLTGCTMTGATTYSGITNDITTGTNEALRLRPNGTGNILMQSGNSLVDFETSAGSATLRIDSSTGQFRNIFGSNNAIVVLGATLSTGYASDANATTTVHTISDTLSGTAVPQLVVYGEGKVAVARRQAVTCTTGTQTVDPTSSIVYLTNTNAGGCVWTVQETSAILGSNVTFVVVSNTGGVNTFPDVANVLAAPACADTTGLAVNDTFTIHYTDATDDLYVGMGCGDN